MPFVLEWIRGVRLKDSRLWFDALRHDVMTHLSSARQRGLWRHRHALCTAGTRELIRVSSPRFAALTAPFGRPVAVGELQVTLCPAGVLPGSSLALVERGGESLLVALGFALEGNGLAEPFQPVRAGTVVVRVAAAESGAPRADLVARAVGQAAGAVREGVTPVFGCHALGGAMDMVMALTAERMTVRVHPSIERFARAFRAMGFDPGPTSVFRGRVREGEVLLVPEGVSRVTVPGRHVSRSFHPPAMHGPADCQRLVEITGATSVVALGPGAEGLAGGMRTRGIRVEVLDTREQLVMSLGDVTRSIDFA